MILKEGFKEADNIGKVTIDIPPGFVLQSISFSYIPKYITDKWSDRRIEMVKKQEAFVFYYRGHWIFVNKEDCEVPVSIGWRYNI